MCSWSGNEMSAAKRPPPVTSGRSSSRRTERPTNFCLTPAMMGRLLGAQLQRRRAHRLDDVLVAGAAAQVRGEHVDQLVIGDLRLALQHARDQHEEARRAEAALQA